MQSTAKTDHIANFYDPNGKIWLAKSVLIHYFAI